MNTRTLTRLANAGRAFEKCGQYIEADHISNILIKVAASWQSINTDIPMPERMWEWTKVRGDFGDAQEARENHPRYKMDETMGIPKGVFHSKKKSQPETSIENLLHPEESADEDAGIKNMFYDGHSSLMQGEDYGKTFKQIERDKVEKPYINLVPTFTSSK